MGFGIGADRYFKRVQFAQTFDQFRSAGIAIGMRHKFAVRIRCIPAQRDDMTDPCFPIGVGDIGNFALGCFDAG